MAATPQAACATLAGRRCDDALGAQGRGRGSDHDVNAGRLHEFGCTPDPKGTLTMKHPLYLLCGAVVLASSTLGAWVGHRVFGPRFERGLSDDARDRRRAVVQLRERRIIFWIWAVCIIVSLALAIG